VTIGRSSPNSRERIFPTWPVALLDRGALRTLRFIAAVIDLREDEPVLARRVGDALERPLAGRLAVVTGGSGRVGRATALALADAGARVCVIGRDLGRLRETTEAAGQRAPMLYLQCDVGSVKEIEGLGEFIERFDRPIDVLVHAAGVSVSGTVDDGDATDLDEQYLVNVRGPLLVTQTFLPQLRQGPGHVVFLRPTVDRTTPTAVRIASAGVEALADGLAAEERDRGLRVSSVELGTSAAPVSELAVAASVVHAVRATTTAVQRPGDPMVLGVDIRFRLGQTIEVELPAGDIKPADSNPTAPLR